MKEEMEMEDLVEMTRIHLQLLSTLMKYMHTTGKQSSGRVSPNYVTNDDWMRGILIDWAIDG